MKKPYDPKLRAAMEDIKAVLRKHDVMGLAILASPTHSEFLCDPQATWSVAKIEAAPEGGHAIRFRSKRDDFPSREAQHAATEATVHGIESFHWLCFKLGEQMGQLVQVLRTKMTILTNVGGLMGEPDSVPGDGK